MDYYTDPSIFGNKRYKLKKQKTVKPFEYKEITHQQFVDMINADHPVNLKYNHDLIDRVYARYPLISKAKVAVIIKTVFATMRDLLLLGDIMNFHGLFFNTKIHIFKHAPKGIKKPAIKVQLTMPPAMKKVKNDE